MLVAPAAAPAVPPLASTALAGIAPAMPTPPVDARPTDAAASNEETGTTGLDRADASVVPAVREVPAEPASPTSGPEPARPGDGSFTSAPSASTSNAAAPPQLLRPSMPPAGDPAAVLPQSAVQPPVSHAVATARLAPVPEAAVAAPAPPPSVPTPPPIDEEMLVKQALQRYRSAYEGLDARSAQAVWPAVDEAALARAFDGLESQHLTFDVCTVQLGVDRAAATCRGTTRYVPKVGNREPRIEPRRWTFALHKTGAEWKIDAARAER